MRNSINKIARHIFVAWIRLNYLIGVQRIQNCFSRYESPLQTHVYMIRPVDLSPVGKILIIMQSAASGIRSYAQRNKYTIRPLNLASAFIIQPFILDFYWKDHASVRDKARQKITAQNISSCFAGRFR